MSMTEYSLTTGKQDSQFWGLKKSESHVTNYLNCKKYHMYSLSCCSCTPDNRGLITLITVLNSMVIQRKLIIVQVLIWISNCKISVDIMLSYTSLSTDHARFAQVTADSLYMLLATKRISSISVPFLIVLCMQVTQLTELIATSSYPDLPTEGNVRSFAKKSHLIK